MKRMVLLLTVVSLVVVMLAMSAAPAFAAKGGTDDFIPTCAKEAGQCEVIAPSGKFVNIGFIGKNRP